MSIYFPLPDMIESKEEPPAPKSYEQAIEKKAPGLSSNAMMRMPSKPSSLEKFDSSVYAPAGSRDEMPRTKRAEAKPSSAGKFDLSGAPRDAMPRVSSKPPNQESRQAPVVFTSPLKYSIKFSNKTGYLEKAKAAAIERAKVDADKAFARGLVPDYNILVNSMPSDDQVPAQMNFHSNVGHPRQEEHHAPTGLPRGMQSDTLHNVWIDGRGRVVAVNHGVVNGQYHAMSSTMPIFNPALHAEFMQAEFMKYRAAQRVQDQMSSSHYEEPSDEVIKGEYIKESVAKDSSSSQPFHVQMHEKLYKNSGKHMPVHDRTPAYSGKKGGLDLLCLAGDLTEREATPAATEREVTPEKKDLE